MSRKCSSSSSSSRKRIRAHANPLTDDLPLSREQRHPVSPDAVDWSVHFPDHGDKRVTIADVGCGFGGLMVSLSPLFPSSLILGVEIRERVVEIDQARISSLRRECFPLYQNISVVRCNFMKSAVNYFNAGQLERMFILFPDPHFKKANHRRRVINQTLLSVYAYVLAVGGLLYTNTDVHELHVWMVSHLDAHPLFQRVTESELEQDVCYPLIQSSTEEGQKVSRLSGNKYPAVYRRIKGTTL